MKNWKPTPKAHFKPSPLKIDLDGIRSNLPPALKQFNSSRSDKSKPLFSDRPFGSTMTSFPVGITQNLSSTTYRAKTRQGFDFGSSKGFESSGVDSENFLARQNTMSSTYARHHQTNRSFLPTASEVKREKVPLTKFTFDIKQEDPLSSNLLKFESMMENNRRSNRISTGSTTARPFVYTSTRISTREHTESDYGAVPFQGTISLKRARSPQKPLENIGESRRDMGNGFKKDNSFSSSFSGFDHADLDSKMAKTFRLRKDISTKYKADIQTKEIEKKAATVKKLSNEELIMQNKDKLLVCVDNDEDITEQLQYCFVTRNIIRGSNVKITKPTIEFNIKLDEIVKKMKLPSTYKYLYRLNGKPVFELGQIPSTENVLIISRQIELRSPEDVIQDDLVRDFFEYGTNKDIMIFSKSHIKSRIATIAQTQQMVEDKYHDVLRLFDNGEQLDSAALERILDSETKQRNKEFSGTMNNFYKSKTSFKEDKSYSKRYDTVEDFNRENLNTEQDVGARVQSEGADNEDQEKKEMIRGYIRNKQPLSENKKLDLYQQINRQYKGDLRKIKIEPQETEGDSYVDDGAELKEGHDGDSKDIKTADIGENLGVLLKKWKSPRKKVEYFDIKRAITATTRKDITDHNRSRLQDELVINQYDNLIDAPSLREKKGAAKNYILDNKKSLQKKKSDILKLSKMNRELFLKNIPKNIEEKKLSRRELHYTYILYKALCEVTSQRHKEYNIDDGIDYHSFKNGINKVFIQSDEVAEKIFYTIDCNFSGFLNWEEFINAMVVIRAKTMRDKIDLFIKIADEDGNGSLSKEEIFKLAKICLKKFVTGGDETFLDSLCEYFTKLIFSSVDIDMDDEIPLQSIKEAIISGNAESDLLAMFCGADI